MGYNKKILRQRYEEMPDYLSQLDDYVQEITSEAYQNVYMLSNQVLSRNPLTNDLFRKFLFRETAPDLRQKDIVKRLAIYYYHSLVEFLLYFVTWTVLRVKHRSDRLILESHKALYVVDTFVLVKNVLSEQEYREMYYPGLYEVLEKHNKQFVILPTFFGALVNPRKALVVLELLKKSYYDFVTEFQLLRFSDLFRVFKFIVLYPLDVLGLASRVTQKETLDRLFVSELKLTIDQVTFHSYIRFLVGRRLGKITDQNIRLISWYENQVIDKNLYKGVKETSREVFVFGCQCFISYPPLLHSFVAEKDKEFQVTPERVLVNGDAFLRHNSSVEHRLGVSLRYSKIFSTNQDWSKKINCVIFLSYVEAFSADILNVCAGSSLLRSEIVFIKPHTASFSSTRIIRELPSRWTYTEQDADKLLESARFVITSGSGTAIEAAALGASVVIVASQSSFTCNPMLEAGRGKIWDIVFDTQELDVAYSKLVEYRLSNHTGIRELADYYKSACFVEPRESNIVKALELDVLA